MIWKPTPLYNWSDSRLRRRENGAGNSNVDGEMAASSSPYLAVDVLTFGAIGVGGLSGTVLTDEIYESGINPFNLLSREIQLPLGLFRLDVRTIPC